MAEKETSPRVSSIAGKRAKITGNDIELMVMNGHAELLAADFRILCGSLLSQDETKGQDKRA
jgi:hypothetical protein